MLNANNNKNKKLYHSYDDKIRLINFISQSVQPIKLY